MQPVASPLFSPRFKKNFNLTNAELIGEGNFAQVYKLQDHELKRTFAFRRVEKVESELQDILKEKAINESLQAISSPFILPVYDIIELEKEIYYIIEYCGGGSLWDTLNELPGCRLAEREAARLMLQIGKGLQDLHHHKITHRDLKPENILLVSKYNPKKEFPDIRIADFGLSTTKLIMKTVAGTKEYLSPEQAKFTSYTNAVDIWAMGIIFDQLLHGTTFYNGEDNKQVFHNICTIPYRVRDENISPEIKQILIGMLKKRPYQRPILTHLLTQLNNFLNGVKIKILRGGLLAELRKPMVTDCWDIDQPEKKETEPLKFELDHVKLDFDLQIDPTFVEYRLPELDPVTRRKMMMLDDKYDQAIARLKEHETEMGTYVEHVREDWKTHIEQQFENMLQKRI